MCCSLTSGVLPTAERMFSYGWGQYFRFGEGPVDWEERSLVVDMI